MISPVKGPSENLLVVCPSFGDCESFVRLRRAIHESLEEYGRPPIPRFILVDDSAGADRGALLLEELADVECISTPFNVGHQRALVYGLREIAPHLEDDDLVVTMDADGEDQPPDLRRLLEPVSQDESGKLVAVALRTKRRESLGFKLSYRLFRIFFRLLTGEVVRSGNFAAMRGGLLKKIIRHPYFDISYSATLIGLPLQRVLVPCERGERYEGKSKMNARKLIEHGLGMLVPFTDRIAIRGFVALSVLAALAFAVIVAIVSGTLLGESSVPGWPLFVSLGILILSLIGLGNVALLFASFSQTRALSFADPEILHRDA